MHKKYLNTMQPVAEGNNVQRITANYFVNYILREIDLIFGTTFSKPLSIYFYPTWRCNSKCAMCIGRPRNSEEIPLGKVKEFLLSARKWIGPFTLIFTGGEPLIRKDFWKIVCYASNIGINTSLMTNGTLITEKDILLIKKSGLKYINISLDSLNPDVYQQIRGKPFDMRLLKIIHLLVVHGLRVNINAVITKQNIEELPKLAEFVQNEKHCSILLNPLFLVRCADIKKKLDKIWPNPKKAESILKKMVGYKVKGYPILNSAHHLRLISRYYKNPSSASGQCVMPLTLRVDPSGNAFICYECVGNVTKNSLKEIWDSDKAKKTRKNMYRCRETCVIASCCIKEPLVARLKRFAKLSEKSKGVVL